MKFSIFDLVHWPGGTEPSDYDGARAADLYASRIDEWVKAEEIGFDGIFFGEHHFTPYSITPSPNLMVAALSQRTKRMRIGIMVNVLPFHEPLRLAEEGAMLDLLTRGRLEFGLGRGVDEQEFLRMKMPYQEARPRFEEAIDLLLRCWQDTEVEHGGRFYKLGRASIWPKPLQKPHPPIWITALSDETIVWAARRGYPMSSVFLPPAVTRQRFEMYRGAAREAGHAVGPGRTMLARNIYVAPTDAQAKSEGEGPLNHLFRLFIPAAVPKDLDALPEDYKYYKEFFRPFVKASLSYDDLIHAGLYVVGSPATVTKVLSDQIRETGTGHLLCWMNFGDLSREQALRSEELFAREVIPRLREEFGAASKHERKGAATG